MLDLEYELSEDVFHKFVKYQILWIDISVAGLASHSGSTVSFGLYQVWLMSRGDRFPSVPNKTQQEQERHLLHRGTWHQSEAQNHIQNTHACLRAHWYTNKTDRHANTCTYTDSNTQSDGQGPSWSLTTDSLHRLTHQSFWVTGQSLRPIIYHQTDFKKPLLIGALAVFNTIIIFIRSKSIQYFSWWNM